MPESTPMDTLTNRINYLKDKGYTEDFKITGKTMLTADGKHSFGPESLKITEHFRFEGESDPADMSVLYAIETNNGVKGILIDSFGTYADQEQEDFMQKIREMHKSDIY
jgi:hypothetical protein